MVYEASLLTTALWASAISFFFTILLDKARDQNYLMLCEVHKVIVMVYEASLLTSALWWDALINYLILVQHRAKITWHLVMTYLNVLAMVNETRLLTTVLRRIVDIYHNSVNKAQDPNCLTFCEDQNHCSSNDQWD